MARTAKQTRGLSSAYVPAEYELVAQQLARQVHGELRRWWRDETDPYRIFLEVLLISPRGSAASVIYTATLSAKKEPSRSLPTRALSTENSAGVLGFPQQEILRRAAERDSYDWSLALSLAVRSWSIRVKKVLFPSHR
jgi:hypothetical protein